MSSIIKLYWATGAQKPTETPPEEKLYRVMGTQKSTGKPIVTLRARNYTDALDSALQAYTDGIIDKEELQSAKEAAYHCFHFCSSD